MYEPSASAGFGSFAALLGVGASLLGVLHPSDKLNPASKGQIGLDTVLESIPDAVFLFDAEGRLLACNCLAVRLCNRTEDQLHGISIAGLNDLLSARDEYDLPVQFPSMGVNRALRGEVVRNVRRVFRRPKDGRVVETVTSASPVWGPEGKPVQALLIVRDVTEIAELQRQLANAQRHREVGLMAAGLAHDFHNVLDTVSKAAALLEMSENLPRDRHRTYTRMIRTAVARGAEIVNRVRDYLRSGSGQSEPVDVRQLLEDTLELTYPLWYNRRGIEVVRETQPVAPVHANAADLRRVFTNLIINALDAMPHGGHLTVRCEQIGSQVRSVVSDTGHGIPPERQKQLFEPYFTTKPDGTGLGLSGAQRIVNSFQGNIGFRSEPGKGSTFIVELPATEPAVEKAS